MDWKDVGNLLNDKEFTILNSLYQLNRPCHVDELAAQHKLSGRSIRSYVGRINADLGRECICLQKGQYHLTDLDFLEGFFQDYQLSNYSGQVLVEYMLHKLAVEDKINLSHFVTEFQVSRTTAKNYLNQVKQQLDLYQLSLDHGAGIFLQGKEGDKRRLLLNLLLDFPERDSVTQKLLEGLLIPYQEEEILVILGDFIREMLEKLQYTLSEHSFQILLSYLSILHCRLLEDRPLQEIVNRPFLQQSREFRESEALFTELSEKLQLKLPLEEQLEVINKVMGLHYSTDKETDQDNWFEYDLFISKLIRRFSTGCGYHLVGDFQLYENLLNHIKPAMYRIAHNIKLHAFDYEYIIKESKAEFDLTRDILAQLHFFQSAQDIPQYQDEIALICVYFKQALEKHKTEEKKNVLLLSNYGYGSSRTLMEKIQQHYHVGRMEWVPAHDLARVNVEDFHLIITTDPSVDLEAHLPTLSISPFFQREDRHKLAHFLFPKVSDKANLSQIMELISDHCTIHNQSQLQEDLLKKWGDFLVDDLSFQQSILHFFKEETILLNFQAENVNQVLAKAGELLQEQGFIQGTYTSDLIDSFENYGVYMMIDTDVAIPHTKNKGNVLKTGFTFIRLEKPIHFEDHDLSMFFTFCTINNKEHLEALVLIADIVKNDLLKESLENLEKPEEILAFLAEYERNQGE